MFLVTGATGTVGREVVGHFPADLPVRVMVRDPARAAFADRVVETVTGDHGDPRSPAVALTGHPGAVREFGRGVDTRHAGPRAPRR